MKSVKKESNKKETCFLCYQSIKRGHRKRIIHDNIHNKVNPKVFCCEKHKLMYIFGHKYITMLDFLKTEVV